MQFLVDTLTFKLRCLQNENIFDFLHIPYNSSEWQQGGCFNINYLNSLRFQGLVIGFNGTQYEYCIHMSGKGCRTYEDIRGDNFDWLTFLSALHDNEDVVFTRIDIACDEREGFLNNRNLERCIDSGKYATKCGTPRLMKGGEEICYIGSPKSDCFLRIYNKKMERGYTADELDGLPWNRAEFQLRDERAEQFIAEWICSNDIGYCFLSHCNSYIRFLTKPNDKLNSQRISTANFWKKFLGDVGKLPWCSSPGSEYNLSKCERFVLKQAGSNIITYAKAKNLTPDELWKQIVESDVKLRQDQIHLIKKLRGSYDSV